MNGPGDAVTAVDARTLMTALAAALDWTPPPHASKFPDYGDTGCETETCSQRQSSCSSFGACCHQYSATCNGAGGIDALIEVAFERGVGVFLRNSEPGFRASISKRGSCGNSTSRSARARPGCRPTSSTSSSRRVPRIRARRPVMSSRR